MPELGAVMVYRKSRELSERSYAWKTRTVWQRLSVGKQKFGFNGDGYIGGGNFKQMRL